MKRDIIALLFFLIFSKMSLADDEFSKVEFKAKALTKSIYMLEGAGGNITASIGADGVLLVDDDFSEMSNKLIAKLQVLGGASPRFIINTHFHYDHTGGNENFGKTATIIAATEVRDRLMTEQTLWHTKHPAAISVALPIITYDQSLTLHLNSDDIKIVHLHHGHTDGDTVVFFDKNKVISMGDLYFAGMYPIFHPEHEGDLNGYIKNIEQVIHLAPNDSQIVPGHGPLSNIEELKLYYEMLIDSVAAVKAGIKKGKTLEEIQKNGLPLKWESFGHGYLSTEKWIALLYKSLKSETKI